MKVSNSRAQEQMNWVDYCDSLSNEYFALRAPAQKAVEVPARTPDHAALLSAPRETARALN
jgi:hypothetical protein